MIGMAAAMSGQPLKSHFKTAPSTDTDIENLLVDTAGDGRVGRIERVALKHIYTTGRKIGSQWERAL